MTKPKDDKQQEKCPTCDGPILKPTHCLNKIHFNTVINDHCKECDDNGMIYRSTATEQLTEQQHLKHIRELNYKDDRIEELIKQQTAPAAFIVDLKQQLADKELEINALKLDVSILSGRRLPSHTEALKQLTAANKSIKAMREHIDPETLKKIDENSTL